MKLDNHPIIDSVRRYIAGHIPLSPRQKVLVGLSGGADSVALLSILVALGYRCEACHCNFNLRGEEAMRDRNFAADMAAKLDVPFREISFDTRLYAAEHKLSIEMACRELRYEWFEQQRCDADARYIAVAHHRDDSVETILLNLIRGTGVSGLTGIHPVNGAVIRPLLSLGRDDIEAYLADVGLDYITDSSNHETVYTRNKIRLQLLPLLAEINPAIYDTLQRVGNHMADVETIYREGIIRARQEFVVRSDDGLHIDIDQLRNLPGARSHLFELVREYGFQSSRLDDIFALLDAPSGKYVDASQYRVLRDRETLIIYPFRNDDVQYTIDENISDVSCPISLHISRHIAEGYAISRRRDTVCFDADKLPFPLTIRRWREGDRFRPFGMKGSQKLSDYFSNNKYSLSRKQSTWLLCAGEEIVWIIGERASDCYKITSSTRNVLQIVVNK